MAAMRKPPAKSTGKQRRKGPRTPHLPSPSGQRPKERRTGSHEPRRPARAPGPVPAAAGLWLYGVHAVLAALDNPRRRCQRLLVTREAQARFAEPLGRLLKRRQAPLAVEPAEREALAALLPPEAVHQGLALAVAPLEQPAFEAVLGSPTGSPAGFPGQRRVLCALDQVTDPQNVGAILRSAAAFGAAAVIGTQRHAAAESGALAKAASGALERVPYLQVTNLARSLEQAKRAGYWTLGLAANAGASLAATDTGDRVVLVLGAEGSGLRRLTQERCDLLARLPTLAPLDQLNVANAAAVAFYELLGRPRG
jgi:23S rRNA (guanosine2251-2'-O)-methyltransferase